MLHRVVSVETQSISDTHVRLEINLRTFHLSREVAILCPKQKHTMDAHRIQKNGHDTKAKGNPQHYRCKTCGAHFYARTSKIVHEFESELKHLLKQMMVGGRLKLTTLAARLHTNTTITGRLMGHILEEIQKIVKAGYSYMHKRRRSANLFVDETFISIYHETWYLIVIVSGNNKVMAVELVKHRDERTLFNLIRSCIHRLCFPLQLLITDGLMTYRSVAVALGISVIHVRHIHQPPYGRIEIEIYTYQGTTLIRTDFKTTNEIMVQSGIFNGQYSQKTLRSPLKKRGRKAGGTNRPKWATVEEKHWKQERHGKRGRQKGTKNKPKPSLEVHVFHYLQKVGVIHAMGGSSETVAAVLTLILHQFAGLYITTNLVEKEFSVLKELLSFRGCRDLATWHRLVDAYYAIRDDPRILDQVFSEITFSSQFLRRIIPALAQVQIQAS